MKQGRVQGAGWRVRLECMLLALLGGPNYLEDLHVRLVAPDTLPFLRAIGRLPRGGWRGGRGGGGGLSGSGRGVRVSSG